MVKSPIAYPGAKGKVCNKLLPMFPDNIRHWKEAFFGGGSVTIAFLQSGKAKSCETFTVSEIYPELYYFWESVRNNPHELYGLFKDLFYKDMVHFDELKAMTPGSAEYEMLYRQVMEVEAKKLWGWVQSVDVAELTEVERGARFFLSSKMSFSGVADSGGMSKDRVLEVDLDKMQSLFDVSKLLQKVELYNQDYSETLNATFNEKDSFVFLDPPYITQEVGNLYGKNGSTHVKFNHKRLAKACMELKCPWLMTLDDCVKARKLYKEAFISEFYIPYTMISSTGREDRLNGEEIIISNYYNPDEVLDDF